METLAYILAKDGTPIRVDADDLPMLLKHRWYIQRLTGRTYAIATGIYRGSVRTTKAMHRMLVLNSAMVDHRNGNGLDNRRLNLRPCTNSQNQANRQVIYSACGYKGVSVSNVSHNTTYCAHIRVNGKYIHVGAYVSKEDAARAYDHAAVEHFGQYAYLNFPEDGGRIVPRPIKPCGCGSCQRCKDRARLQRWRAAQQHPAHPATPQGAHI
jgi:hypothetical protein